MFKKLRPALAASLAAMLLTACPVSAEDTPENAVTAPEAGAAGIMVSPVNAAPEEPEEDTGLITLSQTSSDPSAYIVTQSRYFVRSGYVRRRKVEYYDNVYCYNHTQYVYTPFSSVVPSEYFVVDDTGCLAIAPIVLDITDAMRERLYGGDTGYTALLYGQYCERIRARDGREGFSGIHEGIDFINEENCPLYAILGGEVTRAGDSNGTVGVYNEVYDVTVLYLHCEKIAVKRGDIIEAGTQIGVEGNKNSGSPYTHVEIRFGRHTSSNSYRDINVESDLPYAVMQRALGVVDSGREPVTSAAITRAEEMRRAAEEEALRQAEEEARRIAEEEAAAQRAEEEQQILDDAPDQTPDGYGFDDGQDEDEAAE